jgi:hypothetical protein
MIIKINIKKERRGEERRGEERRGEDGLREEKGWGRKGQPYNYRS